MRFFSQAAMDGETIQRTLAAARAVVIGGGVIGSHALASMGDSGVGTLRIVDQTTIEERHLAGSALLRDEDVGRRTAEALKERVDERNPFLRTEAVAANPLAADELKTLFRDQSCVVVGLDSPSPALLDAVNEAALQTGTRWISGQIYRGLGLVGPTVIPGQSPCYKCYELRRNANLENYEETMQYESRLRQMTGIRTECVAPKSLASLIGSFLAVEAVRLLTGVSYPQTVGRTLHLDFFGSEPTIHRILRFPTCPACGYGKRRGLAAVAELPRRK
jgi:bacteriocin biosynthesis cyclodehydratase domain-containing protein